MKVIFENERLWWAALRISGDRPSEPPIRNWMRPGPLSRVFLMRLAKSSDVSCLASGERAIMWASGSRCLIRVSSFLSGIVRVSSLKKGRRRFSYSFSRAARFWSFVGAIWRIWICMLKSYHE